MRLAIAYLIIGIAIGLTALALVTIAPRCADVRNVSLGHMTMAGCR
jgi:hypothetical protein